MSAQRRPSGLVEMSVKSCWSRRVSRSWYGGVAWEGHRTARLRAANVSPVRGLFCVGAGAHPGAGVPATALGAAIVASAVGKA